MTKCIHVGGAPPVARLQVLAMCIGMVVLSLAGTANADQLYVDVCTDSPGDGSQSNPYPTLTKAVEEATSGDSIIVKTGSYPEILVITEHVAITASGGSVIIGTSHAACGERYRPIACTASTIDLFENDDPFEVFEVTLRADFNTINTASNKDDATSPGTLTYVDPTSNIPVSVDTIVEARGKSRFKYCGWRPLRLRFDSDPNGTLLEGTGKVIKIVTHCGNKSGDQWILGGTPEEHTRRLMQEFVLYEILGTTGTAALETRLARITYEDPNGLPLETNFAFFRERENRAAQRCGLERLESDEGDPRLPSNLTSLFQVQFHHKFLFSHDFVPEVEHNVIRMGSPSGVEYYMPYDFDLTGIIRPEYFKNKNWSIEENGEHLISWLSSQSNQELVRAQVIALLQHEEEMRQRIAESLVDDVGKARIQEWFEDHIQRLRNFLQ